MFSERELFILLLMLIRILLHQSYPLLDCQGYHYTVSCFFNYLSYHEPVTVNIPS